jgi:hypothetical protein
MISTGMLHAAAEAADPARKMSVPTISTRLRPKRSESLP